MFTLLYGSKERSHLHVENELGSVKITHDLQDIKQHTFIRNSKQAIQTFLRDFVRSLGTLRQGSDARSAQGPIRHNSLRFACGTYSGSPLHCAQHLKDSHYEVHEARTLKNRGVMPALEQFITREYPKNRTRFNEHFVFEVPPQCSQPLAWQARHILPWCSGRCAAAECPGAWGVRWRRDCRWPRRF